MSNKLFYIKLKLNTVYPHVFIILTFCNQRSSPSNNHHHHYHQAFKRPTVIKHALAHASWLIFSTFLNNH